MFFNKLWKKLSPDNFGTQEEPQSKQDHLNLVIETFWQQVKASEQSLNKLEFKEIMDNINRLLAENQLDVVAEITSGLKKNHKIIFTSNGKIECFEQVMEISRQAPDLDFFEIVAFRQRAGNVDNFMIQLSDHSLSLSATELLIQYKEDQRKIYLGILFGKTIPVAMVKQAQTLALTILSHILGEYELVVRVNTIEFLENAEDTLTMPANQFATIFDNIWEKNLNHSGIITNDKDKDQWLVFKLDDKLFGMRNEAANVLVGDKHYCYALTIAAEVDSKQTISKIYDLEDAITSALGADKQGIHCQNIVSQGTRTMLWYVTSKYLAIEIAQSIVNQYKTLSINIVCEFDPCWSQYLAWVK